ncbi:E3 ubiquitin-protein ligase TRIM39-like isoform X2 [Sceloporus undulatus]|uniref:E3 ubiquitin-protein ligase TRIM39-like isoform X2 n=1 Tax=Sceloporus undulatus TaxID=8520 RepID=UPI001C4CD074|nr:E3 ubiquitin-protein ligase TRIM39-like isoform X2 [Sceloporus undulatus]
MESTEGSAMAAKRPREWLWCEALCPICVQYFTDPVSLECGHSFCKACLLRSWEEMPKSDACVRCDYPISTKTFKPNEPLAHLVEETKQVVERAKEEVEKEGICETHQKSLNYFCEDDQTALCGLCMKSDTHQSHNVTNRSKYLDQIEGYLNQVMTMGQDLFCTSRSNAEGKPRDWLKQTEIMRKKVVAEFKRLHQLLEDQESMWMSDLVALEKTIVDSKKSYEAKAQSQASYVDEIYYEKQDRYWDDDMEFLQEFGKSFVRFDDRKLENPVTFPTELKTRIQTFCDRKTFLGNVLKTFNVQVILDQDTANIHLFLSQDLRTVEYRRYFDSLPDRSLPKRPRGFRFLPCVLGRQGFTSGRHYWEVKVCGLGRDWALGIARESVARDDTLRGPQKGVWVVGRRQRDLLCSRWLLAFALQEGTDDTVLILRQKPEKIRVCLDCSEGRVAFSNADTDEFIYSFSSAIIASERIHPFFWLDSERITLLML